MSEEPVYIDYSNPDEQAEVVEVGNSAWLRFRSQKTGAINEWADLGEEDPRPLEEVQEWAVAWNRHGVAGWPEEWILSLPKRPMRARLAVNLLLRMKVAKLVWMPIAPNLYRSLGPTLNLIEKLKAVPGEEPAIIELEGGHRFMITKADQVVMDGRPDGLATVGEYGAMEDLSVRLFGRLLEDGEVPVPRGLPAA